MQIHKLTTPHLTDVQRMARRSVINVCIYLLKLIHIKQAYSTLSTEYIATLLNYKHFSAGVLYAAPYAHKYIQVSAINVLKTNKNIK